MPWRLIDGPEAADAVADEIARAPVPARVAHLDFGRADVREAAVRSSPAIAASAASSTCRATAPTINGPPVTIDARRGARQGHHHQRPADHAEAAER